MDGKISYLNLNQDKFIIKHEKQLLSISNGKLDWFIQKKHQSKKKMTGEQEDILQIMNRF